jgi:hypothetical protein
MVSRVVVVSSLLSSCLPTVALAKVGANLPCLPASGGSMIEGKDGISFNSGELLLEPVRTFIVLSNILEQ